MKVDLDKLLELESKAIPEPWEAYGEADSPAGKYLSGVRTLAKVPYHEAVVFPCVGGLLITTKSVLTVLRMPSKKSLKASIS